MVAFLVNSERPVIGRYSLSKFELRTISSAYWAGPHEQKFERKIQQTYLFDTWQNVGLALVISVGTDSQVDLARVLICSESLSNTCSVSVNKVVIKLPPFDVPRMGSGGPAGTADHTDTERTACLLTSEVERRLRTENIFDKKRSEYLWKRKIIYRAEE